MHGDFTSKQPFEAGRERPGGEVQWQAQAKSEAGRLIMIRLPETIEFVNGRREQNSEAGGSGRGEGYTI